MKSFARFAFACIALSVTCASPIQHRVIGGQIAPTKQFPHFASLRINDLAYPHFCSATILSAEWLLTTAICINERTDLSRITVVVGTTRMNDHGQRHSIEYVERHPNFTGRNTDWMANNLALAKLHHRIEFNQRVQPAVLSEVAVEADQLSMVAGWGGRHSTDRLRMLVVKTMRNGDCQQQLTEFQRSYVLAETVCTHNEPAHGLSHGDAGTGLINGDNGRLLGVASVIMFDATGGRPDIFVRVQPYLPWIRQIVGDQLSLGTDF